MGSLRMVTCTERALLDLKRSMDISSNQVRLEYRRHNISRTWKCCERFGCMVAC